MRHIKFRVFHYDEFEMYYFDSFAEIVTWQGGLWKGGGIDTYRSENPNIGNVTFMQFTGLKDRNGVEIYEGDILKMNNLLFTIKFMEDFNFGYFLLFAETNDYFAMLNVHHLRNIEVVGNVHKDRKLLSTT